MRSNLAAEALDYIRQLGQVLRYEYLASGLFGELLHQAWAMHYADSIDPQIALRYKVPDFNLVALDLQRDGHFAQPSVGVFYRFGGFALGKQ